MTKKKILTPQEILKQTPKKPVLFYVPEWDGYVHIKQLTTKERDAVEKAAVNKRGQYDASGLRNAILLKAVVTENGLPMFSVHDLKDLASLGAAGVTRVAEKAMKMCGINDEDTEDEAEDFDGAPGADESTD